MGDVVGLLVCLALAILQAQGKPGQERVSETPHLLDPQCAKEVATRVINGQNANILSNPWMAQIIQGGYMVCGGSLISKRYVLTAAHCQGKSIEELKVRLGDYNIGSQFDCTNEGCIPRARDFAVTHVFVYQSFVDFHQYDLALMRLNMTVRYGVHIRPVCLLMGGTENWRRNVVQSIPSFNVTGWGRTATTQVSFSLQQTTLQHYDISHCARTFARRLDHTHICAGQSTSSTCNGDSGGPLTAKSPAVAGKHILLFGLVSYGLHDCDGPSVFTSVLSYSNWIRWHIVNYP